MQIIWTPEEDAYLRAACKRKEPANLVAAALGRSPRACRHRCSRLGIELGREGQWTPEEIRLAMARKPVPGRTSEAVESMLKRRFLTRAPLPRRVPTYTPVEKVEPVRAEFGSEEWIRAACKVATEALYAVHPERFIGDERAVPHVERAPTYFAPVADRSLTGSHF